MWQSKIWVIYNPRMYVQAILQEPISRTERENILYKHAARVLGLELTDKSMQ